MPPTTIRASMPTVRTRIAVGIALLVIVWITVLYWAISHNALPHLFSSDNKIFSHIATLVEYRSAHGLVYDSKWHQSQKEPDYFKLGDLLAAWNPDDTSPAKWLASVAHPSKGHGLARFDYSDEKQREVALKYRDLELPFVVYNVPELDQAITKTFNPETLLQNMGTEQLISVERFASNNYMYYHAKKNSLVHKRYPDWQPPQQDVEMTYPEFLREVRVAEARPDYVNSSLPLYYFTISAGEGLKTKWIREALPFFGPTPSFFMVDVNNYRGINCRFGMKGVAPASHYDGHRNFIAMLRGRKRYVLQPPIECKNLQLYPRGHPSARHSKVDWSDIEQVRSYPDLYNSRATEIILSMGEVLYIPGNWFHYIVSQDASIQCNARSGVSYGPGSSLGDCGM